MTKPEPEQYTGPASVTIVLLKLTFSPISLELSPIVLLTHTFSVCEKNLIVITYFNA